MLAVIVLIGGIALAVGLLVGMLAAVRGGGITAIAVLGLGTAAGALCVFLMWNSLKAAAEFILLALNVEHDGHRMADGVRNLRSQSS